MNLRSLTLAILASLLIIPEAYPQPAAKAGEFVIAIVRGGRPVRAAKPLRVTDLKVRQTRVNATPSKPADRLIRVRPARSTADLSEYLTEEYSWVRKLPLENGVRQWKESSALSFFCDRNSSLAFETLQHTYGPALLAHVRKRGNRATAEDVVQKVWTRLLLLQGEKECPRSHPNFIAWLHTVANGKIVEGYRKAAVREKKAPELPLPSQGRDRFKFIIEMKPCLAQQLANDRQVEVALLKMLEEPVADIVELTGVPEGTVHRWWSKPIKQAIKECWPEEPVVVVPPAAASWAQKMEQARQLVETIHGSKAADFNMIYPE